MNFPFQMFERASNANDPDLPTKRQGVLSYDAKHI